MSDTVVEGQPLEAELPINEPKVDVAELQRKLDSLTSTNDRLLAESKSNAEKYRAVRDKADQDENQTLLDNNKWEDLYNKKNVEVRELRDQVTEVKRGALENSIGFQVAKHAADVDPDYLDELLSNVTARVSGEMINKETLSVSGIAEIIDDVRRSKPKLFKLDTPSMQKHRPGYRPEKTEVSKEDQLKDAFKVLHATSR